MSKPGHVFKLQNRQESRQDKSIEGRVLSEDVNARALKLLLQELHLHSDSRVNSVVLDIQEVEAYPELEGRYKKAFERIERTPNSLFIVKYRGGHMINVVVDPEKQSVIYLKSIKTPRHKSKSAGTQFKRVLGSDVMQYDGCDLLAEDSPVQLMDKSMEKGILDIAVTTREKMEASGARAKVGNVIVPKG